MTYVIGWRNKNRVYISGDMAVTREGKDVPPLGHDISSFKEKHVGEQGKTIQESLQKVINLDSRMIFGMAGDAKKAANIAEDLRLRVYKKEFNKVDDFFNVLGQSIENCLLPENRAEVQIIVGMMIGSDPTLFSYNANDDCNFFHHNESVQIGSLSKNPFYNPVSAGLSSFLIQGQLPDDRLLACVNGIIQSYGVHDNLIEKYGVGGAIVGTSICSTGVFWQQNTLYVLYHDISNSMDIINLALKDGVTILRDYHGSYRAYINAQNTGSPESFDFNNPEKVLDLKRYINSDVYDYIVFLSRKIHKVVIIERNEHSKNSAFIKLDFKSEKDINVEITAELAHHLKEKSSEKDNSIPIHFTFLQDRESGTTPAQIQSLKGEFRAKG